MVEVSKLLFEEACTHVDCHYIMHPWEQDCLKASVRALRDSAVGSCKFYSMIYLAQVLMRGKQMFKSKEEWYKMGQYYARSSLLGFIVCSSGCILGCVFRKLQGNKFQYYTYVLTPNTVNGLSIFLEPPSRRGLVINLFSNLAIEYWMRTLNRAGYISLDKYNQAFMFMLGSGLLFYLMRLEGDKEHRTPLFWLFTPEKVKWQTEESEKACPHTGTCESHIMKGFLKMFGVGAALRLSRVMLPKLRTPVRAFSSIGMTDFKMAMFFGSYIGIYRAVVCLLCRKRGFDSPLYALPAGYLAGLSFLIKPSLGFAIAALTGAVKLYSTILYERQVLPARVPLPELLYCFCQGLLFHARFMHPDVTPQYMFTLMNGVSNGSIELLYKNMVEAVKTVL